MLTCAMCGKPMQECCDIFYEAEDEAGNSVVICGDCASLMAFIDSAEYAADDEEQICKGQKCPEQKEDK